MGVYHIYHKRRTEVQAKGWATSKRGKDVKTGRGYQEWLCRRRWHLKEPLKEHSMGKKQQEQTHRAGKQKVP